MTESGIWHRNVGRTGRVHQGVARGGAGCRPGRCRGVAAAAVAVAAAAVAAGGQGGYRLGSGTLAAPMPA